MDRIPSARIPGADLSIFATTSDLAALASTTPQYVAPGTMHCADVVATFPAGAAYVGKLARVDDLYGSIAGSLRCTFDAESGVYAWAPNLGLGKLKAVSIAAGDLTFMPLAMPNMLNLSGTTPVGGRKFTIEPQYLWPGFRATIMTKNVTSILGPLKLLLGTAEIVSMALNQKYEVAADFSSGQPALVTL